MVRLTKHGSISSETIRRRLAENQLKPWLKKMWCISAVGADFTARMEDVLDLYAEKPDAPKPGRPARFDYVRNRTASVFVFVDAHRPWRHAKVTELRACGDFAECMRDLVDVHYPRAERVRVVLDNLSTHTQSALYEAFEPEEAPRILRRLELHCTPKHASWLNMVEIEIGVMVAQCLDLRIPTLDPDEGGEGVGASAQSREGSYEVALHRRECPAETRPGRSRGASTSYQSGRSVIPVTSSVRRY